MRRSNAPRVSDSASTSDAPEINLKKVWQHLKVGDDISLFSQGGNGFLESEGFADRRLFVNEEAAGLDINDFSRCVFRIQAKNQYTQEKQLKKFLKDKGLIQGGTESSMSAITLAESIDMVALKTSTARDLQRLLRSCKAEKALNQLEGERLSGNPVRYGDIIQILHVKSKKFVSVKKNGVGELENNTLRVVLDEVGSAASWFQVTPRYRAQEEGDIVRITSAVTFTNVKTGEKLHCSDATFGPESNLRGKHEVNASASDKGWRVMPYAEFQPNANKFLRGGDIVRLYQQEDGVWMTAHPPEHGDSDVFGKKSSTMTSRSTTTLWQIERDPTTKGGVLLYNDNVRIRHFGTGAYLRLAGEPREVERVEIGVSIHVEDDLIVRNEAAIEDNLWTIRPIFTAQDASGPRPVVTSEKIMLCSPSGGDEIDESGGEGGMWLHVLDPEVKKTEMMEDGCMMGKKKEGPRTHKIVGSSHCWDEDVLTIVRVDEQEIHDVSINIYHSNVQSLIPVFVTFLEKHESSPDAPIKDVDSKPVLQTLINFIYFCTESTETDALKREGIPNQRRQNALRELGVMDMMVRVLKLADRKTGVFAKGIETLYEKRTGSGKLFYSVCQHAYRLLKQIVKENSKSALYLRKEIDFMQSQLGWKLKTADTLMEMFKDNSDLLPLIKESQITFFVDLIATKGRLARYANFLKALLSCDGSAINKNQTVVLNSFFKNESAKKLLFRLAYDPKGTVITRPSEMPGKGEFMLLTDFIDAYRREPEKYDEIYHYFLRSIEMYAELCRGRNAEAIAIIQSEFLPYECICDVLTSKNYISLAPIGRKGDDLTGEPGGERYCADVKKAFCVAAMTVYLDVDPQHDIPAIEYAHVLDEVQEEEKRVARESFDAQAKRLGFKALKVFISTTVQACRSQASSETTMNELLVFTLEMLHLLMRFGFYDSFEECMALTPDLINVLDASDDIAIADANQREAVKNSRRSASETNRPIHIGKLRAFACMDYLMDRVLAARVYKSVYAFKHFGSSRGPEADWDKALGRVKDVLHFSYYGLEDQEKFSHILLDLMNYDYSPIVTKALITLIRIFNQEGELVKALSKVQLLVDPSIINIFRFSLTRVTKLNQIIKPNMTAEEEKDTVKILEELMCRCTVDNQLPEGRWDGPVPKQMKGPGQDFLRSLGIVDDIIRILKLPFSNKLPEEKGRREVFLRCYRLLLFYCRGKPENQEELLPYLDLFLSQMGVKLKAADTFNEIFYNNRSLCSNIESRILRHFVVLTATRGLFPRYLKFLQTVTVVGDVPIRRNQALIYNMMSQYESLFVLYNDHYGKEERRRILAEGHHLQDKESMINYHVELLRLLSMLCDSNTKVAEGIMSSLINLDQFVEHLEDEIALFVRAPFATLLLKTYLDNDRNQEKFEKDSRMWRLIEAYGKECRRLCDEVNNGASKETMSDINVFSEDWSTCISQYMRLYVAPKIVDVPGSFLKKGRQMLDSLISLIQAVKSKEELGASCDRLVRLSILLKESKIEPSEEKAGYFESFGLSPSTKTLPKHLATPQKDKVSTVAPLSPVSEESPLSSPQTPTATLRTSGVDIEMESMAQLGVNETVHLLPDEVPAAGTHSSVRKNSHGLKGKFAFTKGLNFLRKRKSIALDVTASDDTERVNKLLNAFIGLLKDNFRNILVSKRVAQTLMKADEEERIESIRNLVRQIPGINRTQQNAMIISLQTLNYLTVEDFDVDETIPDKVIKNQKEMDSFGCMELVINLIGNGAYSPLVTKEAFELGIALLVGGNREVQRSLLQRFVDTQESAFFLEVRNLLRKAQDEVKENKRWIKRMAEDEVDETVDDPMPRHEVVEEVLRFLQLFCEGHNLKMQRYLQTQTASPSSVDLVAEIVDFLAVLEKNINCTNIHVAHQVMDTLTEFVQGPCREVQLSIVDRKFCESIARIFSQNLEGVNPDRLEKELPDEFRSWKENITELITRMLIALQSLLEGLEGNYIPRRVLQSVDVRLFLDNVQVEYEAFRACEKRGDDEEMYQHRDTLFLYHILLLTLLPYALGSKSASGEELHRTYTSKLISDNPEIYKYLDSMTGKIELQREGNLFRYYYPIPRICRNINPKEKDAVLWEVDRDNPSRKLADFFERTDDLYFGMRHEQRVGRYLFSKILQYSDRWRESAGLLLAFLMNLIILFCESYANPQITNATTPFPVEDYDVDLPDLKTARFYFPEIALIILYILGGIEIVNSFSVLATFMLREAPQVVRKYWKKKWAGWSDATKFSFVKTKHHEMLKDEHGRPTNIFNYQRMGKREFYNKMRIDPRFVGISIWALLRSGRFLWKFMFFVASCLGFYNRLFWAVLLLELMSTSRVVRQVLKAVTYRGRQLLLTVLLGVVISYYFAIFGFLAFANNFEIAAPDVEGGYSQDLIGHNPFTARCTDLLTCFLVNLDIGLRKGDIGDALDDYEWLDAKQWQYIVYTLAYFVIITTILLNVIFGIIIDTFGELRSQRDAIEDDMRNRCFISGIDRSEFDRHGNGFEYHIKEEQNMWMYMYFIIYLQEKNSTEYTGPESYVAGLYAVNNTNWVPQNKAIALEHAEDSDSDEEELILAAVTRLEYAVSTNSEALKDISAALSKMRKGDDDPTEVRSMLSSTRSASQRNFRGFGS